MLDPGANNAADLVDVAHPYAKPLGGDVLEPMGLPDQPSAHLNLHIQIEQGRRFLLALPGDYREAQKATHGAAQLGTQQMPLQLRELVQNGMGIGIQLFQLRQELQVGITHRSLQRRMVELSRAKTETSKVSSPAVPRYSPGSHGQSSYELPGALSPYQSFRRNTVYAAA
ncbi:hypothetical protein D3C78_1300730 [compost metagenome]